MPYWLEIVQLNDLESHFRWEFSQTDANGQAFINPIVGDWRHTQSITSDTAYQLWGIPEPPSLALLVIGLCAFMRRSDTGGARIRKRFRRSYRIVALPTEDWGSFKEAQRCPNADPHHHPSRVSAASQL